MTPTRDPDVLAERLFGDLLGAIELLTVELGRRLDLYRHLDERGALTAAELAEAAGITERYAREWLEQQSAAGILDVAAPGDAATRRYALPDAHRPVLVDAEHPLHLTGAGMALEGIGSAFAAVVRAYREGGGVPYEDYGAGIRGGIAAMNRPGFTHDLAGWLQALPDVAAMLADGGAVLDAGCGAGWSTIALARALPASTIVGVDLDEASIEEARVNAAAAGVADRITFLAANAADADLVRQHSAGGYELVTVFEALHDMGEPVRALEGFRAVMAPGGAVLVADERVEDEFTPDAGEIERLNYAFSVLHCLPATIAESTSIANGTVLRASTAKRWAREAGFTRIEELPIEHDLWRFYRFSG